MDRNVNKQSLSKLKSIYIEFIFKYLTINDSKEISEKFQNKNLFRIYNQIYLR